MCKARLGRQWSKLSQAGIKDIMKTEWEYAIKPQFDSRKEYIVSIPAEAFKGVSMNDSSREPIIKEGRIYFKRCVICSSKLPQGVCDFLSIDRPF